VVQFLIQADFVLTANREDIDSGSSWNQELRKNVSKAFVQAVHCCIENHFRYSWLKFLPMVSKDSFFTTLQEETATQLLVSSEAVLESEGGKMVAPTSLTYVPDRFRDSDSDSTDLILSFLGKKSPMAL
jgi:hypothetical protein